MSGLYASHAASTHTLTQMEVRVESGQGEEAWEWGKERPAQIRRLENSLQKGTGIMTGQELGWPEVKGKGIAQSFSNKGLRQGRDWCFHMPPHMVKLGKAKANCVEDSSPSQTYLPCFTELSYSAFLRGEEKMTPKSSVAVNCTQTYIPKRAPPRCAAWSKNFHPKIIPAVSMAIMALRACEPAKENTTGTTFITPALTTSNLMAKIQSK